MTQNSLHNKRVLVIDPSEIGFGFAVLEGPRNLIDWGLKATPKKMTSAAQKNNHCLKRIDELITKYDPDVVITEDYLGKGFHRRSRIGKLLPRIKRVVSSKKIKFVAYSKAKVRENFLSHETTQ